MLTIKNTKLFQCLQDIHLVSTEISLLQIMTSEKSEFYIPDLPTIDLRNVIISSDYIVFYDRGFSGLGIYRDNSFKIQKEE